MYNGNIIYYIKNTILYRPNRPNIRDRQDRPDRPDTPDI